MLSGRRGDHNVPPPRLCYVVRSKRRSKCLWRCRALCSGKRGRGNREPHITQRPSTPSLPLDPLVPSFIFPQGTGRGKGKGRRANVLIGIAGERTNGVGSIWYRSTFPKAQQPLGVEPNSYNVVQRCEHAQALITAMHQPFLPLAANPAPPSTELAFGGAGQVRRGKGRSIMR